MMRNIILSFLAILFLAGCNLPSAGELTPTPDAVATEVALLLTAMPTPTEPVPTATAEPAQPTAEEAEPTQTEAPTPEAPTAEQPTITPTASADDPAAALGSPIWRDSLNTVDLFYLYESEHTRISHQNGALYLTGLSANGWHGWSLTFSRKPRNFYLEADFTTQTCAGGDLYGLVFRAPNSSAGYFLGFTCDGRYELRARNFEDGSDRQILAPAGNEAINSGSNASNRMGVRVEGERIQIYANGTLLQEVTSTAYEEAGNFGPFIAANATPGFTVLMDEIRLWELP
jgi:hypothetical protein